MVNPKRIMDLVVQIADFIIYRKKHGN